jgi:gliding motility-associated-like protein
VGSPFTLTATVNPDAKAQLNVTQTISCVPFRIRNVVTLVPHVNANSQPAFRWYANNVLIGQGATVPDHVISQPGDTVILKLVAVSLHGCKNDSTSVTFYTIQQPQPSFTLSTDTACGPASILITNTTTPINVINGSTYNWNFGNGQTSTQVQPGNVTFLPNPAGRDTTYYIYLSVTTLCETLSFRDSVLIRPGPRALFQPDTTVYCSPANMRFRNNSLGVNSTLYGSSNRFIWDWGDGRRDTVSDTRTMTKLYTTGIIDTITVKLYAYNECGVDSFAVDIVIYPATITPSLIVFGQNTYGCAPKPVTFINNSVGGSYYTINFGDGSTPYVTPRSNDTITHIYQTAGTYTVTMRAQNSCTDTTVTQLINIYASPIANFTTNSSVYCARDSVRITNTTTPTGSQYLWNMGDGTVYTGLINPTHYYASAGTYTITLIATSTFSAGAACRDTIRRQVVVNPVPVAVFSSNISTYNCSPFTLSAYATPANYSSVEWYVLNNVGGVVASSNGFTFTSLVPTPGNYQIKMVGYNSLGCRDSISTPFTVVASPTVSFTVADTVFCAPSSTVTFTNTSTAVSGSTLSYQWFVNGIVQSTSATSFSYLFTIPANATQPLVYTVRLIAAASVTGCAPVYERTITMLPSGQVNQPLNQISCTGNTVPATVFTTQNTGGVTSYAWTNSLSSIGLSATGTGDVPAFTAANSGLGPVTAIVNVTPTFAFGGRSCAGSPKQYQIVVNPQAQVNQPANLAVCNGQLTTVNFTSSNTGGTTTYSWTNNNPSIGILASNTGSIATFYAINSGTAPVTATIVVTPSYTSGGISCTGPTKTFTITVLPTAQVDQPANQVVCSESTVNFGFTSPNSGGTVTYRWVNSNPNIGLAQSGTGSSTSFVCTNTGTSPAVATITVVPNFSSNGISCDGPSKTFTITVNPNGQVNQPQSQVKCNGYLAQGTFFSTLQTGGVVTYNWVNNTPSIGLAPFGTGDIDSFRVVNNGTSPVVATITVNPTFTNGGVSCIGSPKAFTITVNPTATVNTIANVQVCDGVRTTPINFTSPASGGAITYAWTNSNTAIGLPASGTGNLPAFTASNASSAPITALITVTPTFTNGGISCTGTPRTFIITVLPLPQTRFRVTPDSACAPMVVTFTNLTQYADSFAWFVNGAQFSQLPTPPPMVLTQPGTTYIFTLLAGNTQGGCGPTSFTYTVRTLPTPRASFGLNSNAADTLFACKQLTAQVSNSSYMNQPGNTLGLSYQWYVNNQLQSTGLNPRFTLVNTSYTRDSLFEIKLIVASGAGCIDSLKRWVRLYPEPLASFIINGGTSDCARPRNGLVKTVQNTSLVKLPAQYSWSVYNRTSAAPASGVIISNSAAAAPTFTFPDNLSAADSTYDIRLRVTSPDGCVKDTVVSQVVFARPIVNFRITDSVSCTGTLNVSFLDLSLSPTSSITSRLWNFDDGGQFSTLPAVSHTYSHYGAYFPSLYVTNARGCLSDTMRKRIVVFGAPVADFIANSPVCLGTPIVFTNTSQLGWGSTQFSQFAWDFGDGNTSTQQNPIHTYSNPGTYTVILTIRSDSSCVPRTKSLTVTVSGKPRADFSYSGSCINVPIQFTNLSTVGFAEGGFAVVNWNFGNGQQSTQTNPIVTYNTPGSYSVQLIVNGITCPQLRDTVTKIIMVQRGRADSTYPRIFASRLNRFTMTAVPDGISYLWTPPIGLSHPTRAITDAYYLAADPSTIIYNILIKDSSGCLYNDKQEVWIFEKPDVYAPTAFTPNKDSANDVFIPFYINIKSLESFRIFNRWGVKIFETNDMTKYWDGKINGTNAPLETYTWVVECYDINGVKLMRKGMVTLIRY